MTSALDRPFDVVCRRQDDGRERVFASYRTRDEADRVAAHLMRVGCAARVAGPDDLPLEVRTDV